MHQFSPMLWVSGLNSSCQAWQQAPLLTEPFHRPIVQFLFPIMTSYTTSSNILGLVHDRLPDLERIWL